jgi:CRP-like cAMP-binding protein
VARDQKLDLLQRVPLFAGLGHREIERIGQLAEEVDVADGTVLMRQGDPGRDLMVVISGQVGLVRDGSRLNTMQPGDFFGEIALVDGGPRTATATADGPTRLLVVGHRDFHALMDEFPDIASQILRALAQRVRHLEPDAPQ